MGRRDAVQVTLEVIARMRQLLPNLVVTYGPDWMTLGNGTSADYEGGLVHHTAAPSSLARPFPSATVLHDGRPDLGGPLCNEAVPACTVEAPRLHVVAAHPANHAGASGGRSMGPLPITRLFNKKVRGLEIDYAGSTPMLAGQLLVGHVWSRANAEVVGGGDIERIRAHFETSVTGKWDIGAGRVSVDMADFRRTAATIAASAAPTPRNPQEDDVPTVIINPGQALAVPATDPASVDLHVTVDNPNGATARGESIAGVDLRMAVQRTDRSWWPVNLPGFPKGADQFVTAVGLGHTGHHLNPTHGGVLCVSVENRGFLPIVVALAPHPG